MQFFILFIGAIVFVFFNFVQPPLLFNPAAMQRLENSTVPGEKAKTAALTVSVSPSGSNERRGNYLSTCL